MKWWKTTQQTMGKVLFCLVRHSRVCQTCLWASLTRHKWTLCYWMILVAIEAIVLKEMARVWVETNMKLGTVILIMRRVPLTMIGVRLSLMPLVQNSQNFWNQVVHVKKPEMPKHHLSASNFSLLLHWWPYWQHKKTYMLISYAQLILHSRPIDSTVKHWKKYWLTLVPGPTFFNLLPISAGKCVELFQMRMFHSWVVQLRDVDWYNCRSYQSTLCSIYQDKPVAVSYITQKGFTILTNFSPCYTALQSICTKQSRNIFGQPTWSSWYQATFNSHMWTRNEATNLTFYTQILLFSALLQCLYVKDTFQSNCRIWSWLNSALIWSILLSWKKL